MSRHSTSYKSNLYVLGAGFSRAFVETAPLMNCFLEPLFREGQDQNRFERVFKFATDHGFDPKRVNIESLFTLAAHRKPWLDRREALTDQLVEEDIVDAIHRVLELSFPNTDTGDSFTFNVTDADVLSRFARQLLDDRDAHVLTFNYDFLLENALERVYSEWENDQDHRKQSVIQRFDDRMSFGFIAPRVDRITLQIVSPDTYTVAYNLMYFLKLHGSVRWAVRKVFGQPVFERDLLLKPCFRSIRESEFENVLYERDRAFLIPPHLDKEAMLGSPVLAAIWGRAATLLKYATSITFIGYSFPSSDFHAETLFRRHTAKLATITVVDWVDRKWIKTKVSEHKNQICSRFGNVFPQHLEKGRLKFRFDGAATFLRGNPT
jgi:hypothetical protein